VSPARRIFKGASTTQSAIRELLTILFCEELLVPGKRLTIVAPWVSDVTVLDNSSGDFSALNPEWGQREIRLLEVLVQLAQLGTVVDVAVRPEEHNQAFIRRAGVIAEESGVSDRLRIVEIRDLHTKGVLGDRWVVLGSMNLTKSGIEINEEYITYETAPERIAEARVHFDNLLQSRQH
jgi:phosphatidylserine/phosphatidylglycerophosphate/cardiolipin synthase-like enzyme